MSASTALPRGDGGQRYHSSKDPGYRRSCLSAAGQGGKAGSQTSSSCNRSFLRAGNLAFEKYEAARSHQCDEDPNVFCYVCYKFEVVKWRKEISEATKSIYHECFEDDVEQNEENKDSDEEFDSSENKIEESKEGYVPDLENKASIIFTKNDLNNSFRRYAKPNDVSEDLISELKSQNLWPQRVALKPGEQNAIEKPLLDFSRILLPPLHIKHGLMKRFVKALDKGGKCFEYIVEQFPELSDAKLKEGIFNSPQIRKMFRNKKFVATITYNEKATWLSF
ncbi:hypothetical protein ILUMI_16972 [Ignelater luminosus]|uniref:Uncharacterized protein n=1 Tax=Ignelater luminosus TaxID=2038154 RepID=A0A8K0G805_IGNLU|nr:hypothetical protein ILUMI_16972 [Ignelater luminosus]